MPRWSVVRLIAAREFRDQLRDRRTLFLILGLPILMYPLFIGVGLLFYAAIKEKQFVIAVVGGEHLPQPKPDEVPPASGAVAGVPSAYAQRHAREFSPLIADGKLLPRFLTSDADGGALRLKPLEAVDQAMLDRREADAILVVESDFMTRLERGERPAVRIMAREGEENSKLAVRRLTAALRSWVDSLRATRFARAGEPRGAERVHPTPQRRGQPPHGQLRVLFALTGHDANRGALAPFEPGHEVRFDHENGVGLAPVEHRLVDRFQRLQSERAAVGVARQEAREQLPIGDQRRELARVPLGVRAGHAGHRATRGRHLVRLRLRQVLATDDGDDELLLLDRRVEQ